MDIKKIKIIGIAAVIAIIALSVAYAAQDNVVELDNITFNTTNETNFVLLDEEVYGDGNQVWKAYGVDNKTDFTINIYNDSKLNKSDYKWNAEDFKSRYENLTTQTVDDIVVYENDTDDGLEYYIIIENEDLQTAVLIKTPSVDETVKVASTLEFK